MILTELIRCDFEDKSNNKKTYLRITRVEYLQRLLKLLKMVEEL